LERFEVVEDEGVGFLVIRYESGVSSHDYLQNDLPMAFRCAADEWGVPSSAWRSAFPDELPMWRSSE
jgi:hypothetical protein